MVSYISEYFLIQNTYLFQNYNIQDCKVLSVCYHTNTDRGKMNLHCKLAKFGITWKNRSKPGVSTVLHT